MGTAALKREFGKQLRACFRSPFVAASLLAGRLVGPCFRSAASRLAATISVDQRLSKRALTFWGAVDTVTVLPKATRQQVIDEVRHRIKDLAAGGGFVLAGVHNLQADVPPENIVTMIESVREFGRYNNQTAG